MARVKSGLPEAIEKSLKLIVGRLIKYRAEDIPISRRVCMALRAEYTL